MIEFKDLPPTALVFFFLCAFFPLLVFLSPKTYMYLIYDYSYLKRMELWRPFTGIFVANTANNNLFFIFRMYLICSFTILILKYGVKIDNTPPEQEFSFFVFCMSVMLVVGNCIDGLHTFSECISIALIRYFAELITDDFQLSFFNLTLSPKMYSIISLAVEYLINGGRMKNYWGFLYAWGYVALRRRVGMPGWVDKVHGVFGKVDWKNLSWKKLMGGMGMDGGRKVGRAKIRRKYL